MQTIARTTIGLLLFTMAAHAEPGSPAAADSWLIHNVVIIDGTGAAATPGAARISAGHIVASGDLEAYDGEPVIDGAGQVLAPGFIDTHSHADWEIFERPDATAAVSQGITTVIVGQDGRSPAPLSDFFAKLEQSPAAINLAAFAGHNTLRDRVMGDDFRRTASAAEIERMGSLLTEEMRAGALGLASGLEYEPGIHSQTDEVIALAKIAAAHGGRYISHIRSEDRWLHSALQEIIEIGRVTGMPVQVSHLKLAMKSLWGSAHEIVAKLDAARSEGIEISADIYPYEYWQSNIMVLIPSRDLDNRAEFEFALEELAPPEGIWLTRFEPQPEYVGLRLPEIARLRNTDPVTTFMQLAAESVRHGDDADQMIGTSMLESDIHTLLKWPHTNVCTDGSLNDLHPRGSGSYPRVLGRFVRDQGVIGLTEAIHKMTGLAALHMGLNDRGVIRPGAAADLVLFDPDSVIDNATPEDPGALSSGITTVWVNGKVVFERGLSSGLRPGSVIRRAP